MKLVNFLTRLASDEEFLQEFRENPRGSMRRAELSEEAMEAIASGKPEEVAQVICVREGRDQARFDPID